MAKIRSLVPVLVKPKPPLRTPFITMSAVSAAIENAAPMATPRLIVWVLAELLVIKVERVNVDPFNVKAPAPAANWMPISERAAPVRLLVVLSWVVPAKIKVSAPLGAVPPPPPDQLAAVPQAPVPPPPSHVVVAAEAFGISAKRPRRIRIAVESFRKRAIEKSAALEVGSRVFFMVSD